MATIEDIVIESGVSRSTVCRFLNGSNVRPEAKRSIINAMDKLKYRADAVIKQQHVSIEISTSHEFEKFKGFVEVIHGITQRACEKGVSVQLTRRTNTQITEDYNKWNAGNALKGVIVVGKNMADEEKEKEMLLSKRIPHVFINRVIDDPCISFVSIDAKKAAFDMVDHLIKHGHTKIATSGSPKTLRMDKDKLEGYKWAFHKNGIKVSEEYFFEDNGAELWEDSIMRMLKDGKMPTAYFGICDSYAMRFINIARSQGIRVPEDIAVVGMDDLESAQYFTPALTTVYVPFKKMGITAVDALIQQLTDKEISCIKTILNHRIVVRESCGSNPCPV